MTVLSTDRYFNAQPLFTAVIAPTADPTATSDQYITGDSDVMTYVSGTGTGSLRLWLWDGNGWFKSETKSFAPADNPQVIRWTIPARSYFTFQVNAIATGNVTVTVK